MNEPRKALSARTRFEIFKRDGFKCLYCGATPLTTPLIVFHVDHVDPISLGGEDDPANLVTSCRSCNLGKSNVPLDHKKYQTGFATEDEKDHAEQIREYLKIQRDIIGAKKEVEATALEYWEQAIGDWHWQLPRFLPGPIKDFGLPVVLESIDTVARKGITRPVEQVKYFCGIVRSLREQTKAPKPLNRSDVIRAEWEMITRVMTAYCEYRWGDAPEESIEPLLKIALGVGPDGEAKFQLTSMFMAIDNASHKRDSDPSNDCYLDFKEQLKEEEIDFDHYVLENYRDHVRSIARTNAASCLEFCGSYGIEATENLHKILTEAFIEQPGLTVLYIVDGMRILLEKFPDDPSHRFDRFCEVLLGGKK